MRVRVHIKWASGSQTKETGSTVRLLFHTNRDNSNNTYNFVAPNTTRFGLAFENNMNPVSCGRVNIIKD